MANAGIAGPNHLVWEHPAAAWRQVLDVNLTGVFLCCRAVVPHMVRQQYGRIVNVADRWQGREPDGVGLQRFEAGVEG